MRKFTKLELSGLTFEKKRRQKNLEEHQTTSKMHYFLPQHSKLDSVHMLTWVSQQQNREKKLCSKKFQTGP